MLDEKKRADWFQRFLDSALKFPEARGDERQAEAWARSMSLIAEQFSRRTHMDDTKRLADLLKSTASQQAYYEDAHAYFFRLAQRAIEFCRSSAPLDRHVSEVVEHVGELSPEQKRTLYEALILDASALMPGCKSAYVKAVISWLRADDLDQPDVDALRDWVQSHGYRKAVREKDAAAVRWLGENIEPAQTPSEARSEPEESFIDECHYSETGFAVWKRPSQGVSYCTCSPAAAPATKPASAGLANALRISPPPIAAAHGFTQLLYSSDEE
jgi:hypothetical protein